MKEALRVDRTQWRTVFKSGHGHCRKTDYGMNGRMNE
jgi:hypothetical protein